MTTETDLLKTAELAFDARRQRQSNRVVNLGLYANALLALLKISAGIFGHSKALLADGINSFSDVVYFLFVKLLVKLSAQPADNEHPYGHHQLESIAAVIIGAFVITTGIAIFWDSINSTFDMLSGTKERNPVEFFTLIAALITIVTKIFLMLNANAVSRVMQNTAVSALAKDHRNDIFASLGVAVGITLGLFGFSWVDPLAGALVAIVVAKTGIDILRESTAELMDTVPGAEMNRKIREILSTRGDVKSVESVHTHRFGPYYMVNITIGIDGNLSVSEGNRIADSVEKLLCMKIELLRRVYIHYHPPARRGKRKS
ncbi:MAG TPA: cation diffusion facilitator family transporter [Spirochaetota bacterium]|nr:cation diffusion facilitator family transporter [Spirochaetota bacterium]